MNTMIHSRSTHRTSAFTLIEMLVVITIIGILASMAFPVVTGVMNKARKVRCLAVIKDLHVAIKGYQTEYNHYPSTKTGDDAELNTKEGNEPLLQVLLGAKNQQNSGGLNTRGIKFIDLPVAKNERGGVIGTDIENYKLVDEWGVGYYVIMDTNGDEKVANPDTRNSDSKISGGASQDLPVGVAIYSLGPDGPKVEVPSKDDVTSWRG